MNTAPKSSRPARWLALLISLSLPATLLAVPLSAQTDGVPQVATLRLAGERLPLTASSASPSQASTRAPTPNPKLAEATCSGITTTPGALSSFVFEDDFEGGGLGGWQPPAGASFSVRGVADLALGVRLQGFRGEALLRFDLTSPKGHHFQSLEAPVVVASAANAFGTAPEARNLPGYPHPVTVRFVTSPQGAGSGAEGGSQLASMPWPIAGTHVVSHGLYGSWTVSATLSSSAPSSAPEGAPVVICPATQFTLKP